MKYSICITKDCRRSSRLPSFPVESWQRALFLIQLDLDFARRCSNMNEEPNFSLECDITYLRSSEKPDTTDVKLCADVEEFAKRQTKTKKRLRKQLCIATFSTFKQNKYSETRTLNDLPPPRHILLAFRKVGGGILTGYGST